MRHPILASRTRLAAYIVGWMLIGGIFLFSARLEGAPWMQGIILSLLAIVLAGGLFLSSYYPCKALPPTTTSVLTLTGSWVAASLFMGGVWAALLILIGRHFHLLSCFRASFMGWISFTISGALFYVITVAVHYVLIAQERTEQITRTEQELRVLAREAELKALRAQLNPHFLFNSLNSISALTTIDPKRAREMCVLLSDFLRKSLRLGERSLVALSEELDLLRAYLSIEQIRFGNRLSVVWQVSPEAEKAEVPTLLLQPMVENAIKHGIAALPEGGTIKVLALKRGALVEIRITNPTDPEMEHPVGLGMGLKQVKSRLQGRYGTEAFFEARLQAGEHEVVMVFPFALET